jgi:hypothetical protein
MKESGMAKDAKPRKTTEYVVLCNSDGWAMAGTYTATNALDAMKRAVLANGGKPDGEGVEWVAIPARSWKPMQRTVEQVTKETWS